MIKTTLTMTAFTGALMLAGGVALAADQERDQTRMQEQAMEQTGDRIYGSQLMTEQERVEYRNKMRAAKTKEERTQIRAEHHERMKARAKERGVMLPDEPPAKGGGMGSGMGGGAGPRGGSGSGGKGY